MVSVDSARALVAVLACALLVACGGSSGVSPGADAAPEADASLFPHDGFGAISGDCDLIDTEIASAEPALFRAAFDFEREFTSADEGLLSSGGDRLYTTDNAGGSSSLSEVFAYEYLSRCEDARLLKTETEVVYDQQGKITDMLVDIDGQKLGVSVTRAVAFPFDATYTDDQAFDLLSGKLGDILESTAKVSAEDRWVKQILAVLSFSPAHGETLELVYSTLDDATRADTLLLIIDTNGADDFIYCDGPCQ
jgi:hypothetical protein